MCIVAATASDEWSGIHQAHEIGRSRCIAPLPLLSPVPRSVHMFLRQ